MRLTSKEVGLMRWVANYIATAPVYGICGNLLKSIRYQLSCTLWTRKVQKRKLRYCDPRRVQYLIDTTFEFETYYRAPRIGGELKRALSHLRLRAFEFEELQKRIKKSNEAIMCERKYKDHKASVGQAAA